MGAVYLAEHPVIGRKVADQGAAPRAGRRRSLVERFFNEARAANAIRHPGIVEVIDVGQLPDGGALHRDGVLEGESLARAARARDALPLAEAVDIAVQTASALGAAHAKGIVHRDLKPDNLFLVADAPRPARARQGARLRHRQAARRVGGGSAQDAAPAR